MSHSLQSVPIGKTWALHWHPQLKIPSNPLLGGTLCLYLLHPDFLDQLVVGVPGTVRGMWEACSRTMHISQPMLPSGVPQPKPAMLQRWPRWQGGHRDVSEPRCRDVTEPRSSSQQHSREKWQTINLMAELQAGTGALGKHLGPDRVGTTGACLEVPSFPLHLDGEIKLSFTRL